VTDYADARERILGLLTSDGTRFAYVRTTLSRRHCASNNSQEPHSFSQSVSATNSCKISCNLEGDAHTTPPRPVCSFVLAALPVRTVRFLEYAHEDRLLALARRCGVSAIHDS